MKILYVIDKPYYIFGAEQHLLDVILYQKDINQVKCITLSGEALNDRLEQMGVEVESIEWTKFATSRSQKKALSRAITNFAPDIVHSHKPTATFYASITCKKLGIPHISTIHATARQIAGNKKGIKALIAHAYHYMMQYFSEKLSVKNIFVSDNLRLNGALFPKKAITVHNCVSPKFENDNVSTKCQAEKFLIVSALLPLKRITESIDLFSRIYANNNKATLTILGDSNDNGYKELIDEQIKILGVGSVVKLEGYRSNVEDYYKSNDILLFLSATETFGLVAAEAMFYGMPLICSDIDTFREIVHPDNFFTKDGYVTNDFLDKENLKKVSQNNIEWVRDRFSYQTQQEKLCQIYKTALVQ